MKLLIIKINDSIAKSFRNCYVNKGVKKEDIIILESDPQTITNTIRELKQTGQSLVIMCDDLLYDEDEKPFVTKPILSKLIREEILKHGDTLVCSINSEYQFPSYQEEFRDECLYNNVPSYFLGLITSYGTKIIAFPKETPDVLDAYIVRECIKEYFPQSIEKEPTI